VAASGDLTIQGVTLRNGRQFLGGGILNLGGAVRVVATILSGNVSGVGSGINNQGGVVTITHSTLTGNANSLGGEATIFTSNGTMYIDHSRITQNTGWFVIGGLEQIGGFVYINGSTFEHNGADGSGAILTGGALNPSAGPSTLVIRDSAFIENAAGGSGSGAALAIGQLATVSVTNTTFTRNILANVLDSTFSPESTAIHNRGGILTLTNSTIADNIQEFVAPAIHAALITDVGATTVLQNTIVARNTDALGRDCIGPITSLGNNLFGDLTGCGVVLQPSDLTGDAGLGTSTDNGTPGNAHVPLLATSRAINAANATACPEKDQIGQRRIPHCEYWSG